MPRSRIVESSVPLNDRFGQARELGGLGGAFRKICKLPSALGRDFIIDPILDTSRAFRPE